MKVLRRPYSFFKGVIFSCIVGCGVGGSAALAQSTPQVVYPAGGERLHPGDTCRIEWSGGASSGNVDLLLWNGGGGSWDTVAANLSGAAQEYMWVIPSAYNDSRFRLKVVAQSNPNSLEPVMSPSYFFIVPPPLAEKQGMNREAVPVRQLSAVQVVPNPATEEVRVSWEGSDVVTARICDLQGREIISQEVAGSSFCTFNTKELAAGTYLVDLKSSDGVRGVRKLIVK